MKNITKRLLASIIAAGTLLSVMPAFAEETAEPTVDAVTLADAEDAVLKDKYAEELALLNGLGILTDTNIKMTNSITRAEFLALVMKTIKMDSFVTEGEEIIFYDVLPSNEYYSIIMSAHKLGLVNGDDKGCFNPNSPIDAVAALKILVCALDYGFIAESRGGYPNGYINTARDMGLSDGIKVAGNADWRTAILMIDNALHSYASEQSYMADGKVGVGSSSQTVLERYYNSVRYSGVVTGTNLTLRMQEEDSENTEIEINGKLYSKVRISSADGDALLGKAVIYYINEETDEIYAISPDPKYNTVTVIEPDDIETASTSSIRYWNENDKETRIEIDKNAIFYYNGVLTDRDDIVAADLKPEYGKITLINNNNERNADVVIIESWEDMVVARSSTTILASMYNDGKSVNLKDTDMVFYKNGFEINEYYLGEWDVLKIMMSKDGKAGYADVSGYTLSGTVEKIVKKKDDKIAVVVDGVEYELAKIFVDAYTRRDRAAREPKKGESYTFILDNDDVIYGVDDVTRSNFEYGYLIAVASKGGLDASYKAKIYGYMGSMKIYDVPENIKVNGKNRGDDFIAAVGDRYGRFKSQPIMYKENSKGELVEIKTAVDIRDNAHPESVPKNDIENFSLDMSMNSYETMKDDQTVTITGWTYNGDKAEVLGQQVANDGKTPIFYIPNDLTDEKEYGYVVAYGNLSRWSNSYTNIEVYDLVPFTDDGKYNQIGAIYLYQRPGTGNTMYNFDSLSSSGLDYEYWVVDDAYETVDEEENVVMALEVTSTGKTEKIVYFTENAQNVDNTGMLGTGNIRVEDIEVGSVIQMSYDNPLLSNPKINRYAIIGNPKRFRQDGYEKLIYNTGMYDGDWEAWQNKGYRNNNNRVYLYGEVYYIDDVKMILRTTNEKGEDEFFGFGSPSVTMWDYSNNDERARLSEISALGVGDRVFVAFNGIYMGSPSFVIRIVE